MIGYTIQAARDDRIQYASYDGWPCLSAIVFDTDATGNWGDTPEKPKRRTELSCKQLIKAFTSTSHEFATLIPVGQDLPYRMTIWDYHYTSNKTSPLYAHTKGDMIYLKFRGALVADLPLVPDQKIAWRVETNFASNKTGYMRVFANGDLILDNTGQVTDKHDDYVYFKIGIYIFDEMIQKFVKVYFQI